MSDLAIQQSKKKIQNVLPFGNVIQSLKQKGPKMPVKKSFNYEKTD